MKIVQILPGKIWGGAEQFIVDLGKALTARGHDVIFVCRPSEAVLSGLEKQGIVPALTVAGNLFSQKAESRRLAKILEEADVVHIHDISFLGLVNAATRRLGSNAPRIVLTRHIARASKVMPWNRNQFSSLHAMTFVSNIGKRLWHGANPWFPEQKCRVIHNSIPPFATEKALNSHSDASPLMMFTGRVRRSKGCETIVRALAQLKDLDWQMVFVGACKPADYAEKLKALATAEGIGDRVRFHGFSPNVRDLISQADIGLCPSIVREACPLSPLEFMQQGVPVIATNNGSQPEFIESSKTGILIDPDNPQQLAEAIKRLLCSKEERERIGRQAREYFNREKSYDKFLNKILAAYAL